PPAPVAQILKALCAEVSHLGTAQSPVRLVVTDQESPSSLWLNHEADLFTPGSDLQVPLPGRTAELVGAHQRVTERAPSVARDGWKTDEVSGSHVPPRERVAVAKYVAREAEPDHLPWSRALLIPLSRRVSPRDRVSLAVAMHRAMISVLRENVPPLITGNYPEGGRPANRLAIQVVDSSMPVDLPEAADSAMVLLIPPDSQATGLDAVPLALRALSVLRSAPGGPLELGQATARAADDFWRPSASSVIRLWLTGSPAVPDSRGVRNVPWSFGHAALLSMAFVWKEFIGRVPGRGDERALEMVQRVQRHGAAVLDAAPLRAQDVQRYAHKVNSSSALRPYSATLTVGDLGGDRVVQAIGQSRHLGGGLLVPVDVPIDREV
ncbi:MAG: type I-U CRISPR-associated protein Csb2, partial [Hyphomicrobiaceae bacterium]